MAEGDETKAVKVENKKSKRKSGVRFFEKPEIKIMRLGREMIFSGEFGRLDLNGERIELVNAKIVREGLEITSKKLILDLAGNRITAQGDVKINEGGAHLEGEEISARPCLSGLKFKGATRLYAEDRETAERLLKSGKV